MSRRHAALLALLLAAPVAAVPPPAVPDDLPGQLPPAAAAVAAIGADPGVQQVAAERDAAWARARQQRLGNHEWVLNGQWQSRDAGAAGRFDEWETSLQRALRLPGKAAADRRIGDAEEWTATDRLADARHVAAIDLLDAWIGWLDRAGQRRLADAALAVAQADRDALRQRQARGDAAAVELDAAEAAAALADSRARGAALAEEEARLRLALRFPQVPLPTRAPAPRPPLLDAATANAWAERILAVSHEITLARGEAELAQARAERARLERRADPTLGLRTLSERNGAETAIGVFVSIPLGGAARRGAADEAASLALAAEARARAVETEVRLRAQTLAARAAAAVAAWQAAADGARAQAAEATRLAQAHELGALPLAELLAARSRANLARQAELDSASQALAAVARLLLDAHAYWIGADEHAEHGHAH